MGTPSIVPPGQPRRPPGEPGAELALACVALRIEALSQQERGLALSLARLHPPSLPSDGIGLFVHPGPAGTSVPAQEFGPEGPWERLVGDVGDAATTPEVDPWHSQPGTEVDLPPAALQVDSFQNRPPVGGDPTPVDHGPGLIEVQPPVPTVRAFDGLLEALAGVQKGPDRPLPPASRFMVRVAHVPKSKRGTKRDYDYFEELNAELAARSGRAPNPEGAPSTTHPAPSRRFPPLPQ